MKSTGIPPSEDLQLLAQHYAARVIIRKKKPNSLTKAT